MQEDITTILIANIDLIIPMAESIWPDPILIDHEYKCISMGLVLLQQYIVMTVCVNHRLSRINDNNMMKKLIAITPLEVLVVLSNCKL